MFKELYEAIRRGNLEAAGQILRDASTSASILQERDEWGITLLHWAASLGNALMVELLIRNGAPVNARGSDGWTPLRWALFLNKSEAVQTLVRHGART